MFYFGTAEKYLVQLTWEDETEPSASLKTAGEILDFLDMDDCYPEYQLSVYEVSKQGIVLPLELHGAWHDIDNPLYMKATRPDGSIAFDGYGTDH